MSVCPMCKVNYVLADEKDKVVEVAEELVDIAGTDAVTEEVAEVAATLKTVVEDYRKVAKRFEVKEGEDAVQ